MWGLSQGEHITKVLHSAFRSFATVQLLGGRCQPVLHWWSTSVYIFIFIQNVKWQEMHAVHVVQVVHVVHVVHVCM